MARLAHPSLRGCPVAVALPGARSPLLTVSAEARREGVSRGMGVAWAQRRCPGLRVVPPGPEAAVRVGRALADLVGHYTPLWELARPGHLFLDLSGCGRLLGPPRDVAARVEVELGRGFGLPGSVGVGGSKLVSRAASLFLTRGGVCDVLRGTEQGFLSPLPLDLLPGSGAMRRRLLGDWGVARIGELAAIPRSHLVAVFGSFGGTLQARAAGEDWEPVRPPQRQPVVKEEESLSRDSADPEELAWHLRRLVERACFRLRDAGQVAARLEVWVRYADGPSARRNDRLEPPTFWEHEVVPLARALLVRVFGRRVRVRVLGVGLSRLAAGALQLDLFRCQPRDRRREDLCRALDGVRRRYGLDAVGWGGVPQTTMAGKE